MANTLKHVKIAPKGMGLNDFVAQQKASLPPKASTSNSTGRRFAALSRAGKISTISTARRTARTPKTSKT